MTVFLFGNTIRNHALSSAKLILTCLLLMLTSSAMANDVRHLKIETVHARSATVVSAAVKRMDSKVYVSGRVRMNLPYQPSAGAHIDVYLLDAKGQTLAHKKDHIIVTSQKRDRTQGGQFPYAVSFEDAVVAKAVTARVVYCSDAHNDQS